MRNILPSCIATLLLWAFLLLADDSIRAQQPEQKPITINTDLVTTWAQVTNRMDGSPVKGLGREDFRLHEEGKGQQVSLVKERQPLSVVILVDGSTCVSDPRRWYQRREDILRQLGEDAEIALMAWDSDAVLVQPFTKNQQIVADKLNDSLNFFFALNPGPYGIEPLSGNKIMVRLERTHHRPGEAIYQAAKYLEKAASPERRNIIIVISHSDIEIAHKHLRTATEVKILLEKTATTVYGLEHYVEPSGNVGGIFKTLINPKRELKGILSGTLNHFVKLTGGTTLTGEWEECDELFIKLARMIRSSYTIGYYPENTNFDGRFRHIKLELSPSGKAKAGKVNIAAREGYHAVRRSSPTASTTSPPR
jgi:VWFA-related protein